MLFGFFFNFVVKKQCMIHELLILSLFGTSINAIFSIRSCLIRKHDHSIRSCELLIIVGFSRSPLEAGYINMIYVGEKIIKLLVR